MKGLGVTENWLFPMKLLGMVSEVFDTSSEEEKNTGLKEVG